MEQDGLHNTEIAKSRGIGAAASNLATDVIEGLRALAIRGGILDEIVDGDLSALLKQGSALAGGIGKSGSI